MERSLQVNTGFPDALATKKIIMDRLAAAKTAEKTQVVSVSPEISASETPKEKVAVPIVKQPDAVIIHQQPQAVTAKKDPGFSVWRIILAVAGILAAGFWAI